MKVPHYLVCALTLSACVCPAQETEPAAWAQAAVKMLTTPPDATAPNSDERFPTPQLNTLPPPARWPDILALPLLADDATDKSADANARLLTRFLAAYLLADSEPKLKALKAGIRERAARTESAEEKTGNTFPEYLEELAAAVEQREIEASPQRKYEQFLEELKGLQPTAPEDLAKLMGGEENLKRYREMMAENSALMEKADPSANPDEPSPELQKEFAALQEKYADLMARLMEMTKAEPTKTARLWRALAAEEAGEDESGSRYVPSIVVPDLLTVAGEEKAAELLRELLRARVRISSIDGQATIRFARKLALAQIAEMAVAQWELANSLDSVALYEALIGKFGEPGQKDFSVYEWRKARAHYAFGLVIAGREKEALALFKKMAGDENSDAIPYGMVAELQQGGHGADVWNFLREAIRDDPDSKAWEPFTSLSSKLDREDELREMAESILADRKADDPRLLETRWRLANVYLGIGELDRGIELLREIVNIPAEGEERLEIQAKAAARLTATGHLLEKPELEKAGIDATLRLQPKAWETAKYAYSSAVTTLAEWSPPAAAKLLQAYEADQKRRAAKNEHRRDDLQEILLLRVYLAHLAGEHAEVLRLAREETGWNFADLGEAFARGQNPASEKPLAYMLAVALAETGEKEPAARLLEALLMVQRGYDPAFELYVQLTGEKALPLFEKIAEVDRYEERPLIWKARVLLDAGQVEPAEAAVRAAIAIDPSDGEQPRGDRMRAYAVLRDISEKQGKTDDVKFLGNVVKAIRLSEDADRFYAAGMNRRAIDMYREALGFFSDAYCIQSRLAIQLAEAGEMDDAMIHYQKAYELMPDSFGRVESHCFGCERAFAGERQQSVAEKVFRNFIATKPDKPQVHYLMGYLLAETEREKEALPHYQKAVELDPLYLNAWAKMAALENDVALDAALRQDIALNLVKLDPLRSHSSPDLEKVLDLPRLWQALDTSRAAVAKLAIPEKLFAMTATAAAPQPESASSSQTRGQPSFAETVARHPFVRKLGEIGARLHAR